jgi:hypothetical protein
MNTDQDSMRALMDKDQIRELVMLYSRGVDRKDVALLATLYTKDGTDDHGPFFKGSAGDYVKFLEKSVPRMRYSGHHICNHLISVDRNEGEGEVYAIAYHVLPDGKSGWLEDVMGVRYIDRYRKENGRWYFSSRVVSLDWRNQRPIQISDEFPVPTNDPSYTTLSSRLFARGPRS